ncbi:hydroxylaminobenzene mutase [Pseudonocardia alni]|uniref:Hydroxylaminobenzene mutase n=2 Tax=Pseudonocardia alni TaxID=33907 RepID=A0AA44ZRR6_PSEA5|nr:hydroxylaminobenzene mutase [Pseudonocardia alni]
MVRIGLVELALGAMLGWAVVVSVTRPDAWRRIGIVEPRRLLQAHLDVVLMGLILVAVGLAAPELPGWLVAVLVFGTWVNPALFLPMAWRPDVVRHPVFRVVSGLSFVATSGGLVLAAILG